MSDFWGLWCRWDRSETSATFSFLTVTTHQSSSSICSRTTINSTFTCPNWCFRLIWMSVNVAVMFFLLGYHFMFSFSDVLFFNLLFMFCILWWFIWKMLSQSQSRKEHDTAKYVTRCLQYTGIDLLFHYVIISCSTNQNGEWVAIEICAPWGQKACNKYRGENQLQFLS